MTDNNNSFKWMGVSMVVLLGVAIGGVYMYSQTQNGQGINQEMVSQNEMGDVANNITPAAGEGDVVVAIVNGEEIYRSEIEPMMEQAMQGQMAQLGVGMEQLFPLFLEQYVNGELVLQKAKQADVDDTEEFQEQMKLTREQIMRNVFLVNMADQRVDEDALKKLYAEQVANAPDVQEVKASHILVETEDEAKAIISQLNDGGDFAEMAMEKSTGPTGPKGGNLGYFAKEDMVAEFAEAAFKLNEGDMTQEPVQTQFGWHVIKVTDKRERPKPEFSEVRDELEQALRKQILDQYLQELREESDITLFNYNGEPMQDNAPAAGDIIMPQNMNMNQGGDTAAEGEETTAE